MADRSGEQLDRYRLQRLLGAGNYGEVYLAEQVHTRMQVAVKLLNMQFSQDILENFLREARTLFLLKHPQIIALLDFGLAGGVPFLVMEYAPNGTLSQRHQKGEQVPLETVNAYVQQAAQALQYAHDQRLIHRDIKPQNMLLGEQGQVLLGDFGVAGIAHSEHSLASQAAVGTVAYMAPEQIEGKPRPASDQYSLGICVYEWLCGTRPFLGSTMEIVTQHLATAPDPLRRHAPGLPGAVEAVVLQALNKDPQRRFPDVTAFARALQQALQQPTSALWFASATFADAPSTRQAQSATLVDLPEEATLVPAPQPPGLVVAQEAESPALQSLTPTLRIQVPAPPAPAVPPAPSVVVMHAQASASQLAVAAPLPASDRTAPPRPGRRALRLVLLILACVLLAGSIGGGYAYYRVTRPEPVIMLSSKYIDGQTPVGATSTAGFSVKGSAFSPNEAITFLKDGKVDFAGAVTSNGQGGFRTTLSIGSDWTPGFHIITAQDKDGYTTGVGVKVEIVGAGAKGTPGPGGAPTDSASMRIDALVTTRSGSTNWTLLVSQGSVCSPADDGFSHSQTGTSAGIAYTRSVMRTCKGTYKGGVLNYQEITTSDSYVFASGLVCNARVPYTSASVQGNFTDNTRISGTYTTAGMTYDCNPGASHQNIDADAGTWQGTATITG